MMLRRFMKNGNRMSQTETSPVTQRIIRELLERCLLKRAGTFFVVDQPWLLLELLSVVFWLFGIWPFILPPFPPPGNWPF